MGKTSLNKTRFIAGDASLKKADSAIHKIVNRPHQRAVVGTAVGGMLNRVRKLQSKNQQQLRARDGGLVDLDLLIQAMRLEHGNLFDKTDNQRHIF